MPAAPNTTHIKKKIHQALLHKDLDGIRAILEDVRTIQKRKERRAILAVIHEAIKEAIFKEETPEFLVFLGDLPFAEIQEVADRAIKAYIASRNEKWLQKTIELCHGLDRKNYQSKIFSVVSKELIEAGVAQKDRQLMERGMSTIHMISFRKHRSSIMMDIIPMIIVWSVSTEDDRHLYTSLQLIDVIGDVSKRSILHSEIAKAIGMIGILQRDIKGVREAVKIAIIIKQKQRRITCVSHILERGWSSPLGKQLEDVVSFMQLMGEIPAPRKYEILSVLIEHLLNRMKDKKQINYTLQNLVEKIPASRECIVLKLVKKAEASGDKWYFERALEFNEKISDPSRTPIKDIISSSSSVVEKTGDVSLLMKTVPLLDMVAKTSEESYLPQYLTVADTLLKRGNLQNAVEIFARIGGPLESGNKVAMDTCVRILRDGIFRDETELLKEKILSPMDAGTRDFVITRAVTEFCTDAEFEDIIAHLPSLQSLTLVHQTPGVIIPECIRILIERNFIEFQDPSALLSLANQIPNRAEKEQIVSAIVIGIARVGVAHKNRDLLQRAVGLSCEIKEQRPRSEALGHIIDQATLLAVEQGDLDLLHRMMKWTGSLLERDFKLYAIDSVIKGMITYGIHHQSPKALDEAYLITHTVDDPSLQQQQREAIIEGLVRVGCIRLTNAVTPITPEALKFEIEPFDRALSLLLESVNRSQLSLKISKFIDIILEYAQAANRQEFLIPLTMFILNIEDRLERNAMFYRISGNFRDVMEDLESTDPYEIVAAVLQRLQSGNISPLVLDLIHRLLEQTPDSYKKFAGLCNLADSYYSIQEREKGTDILKKVYSNLSALTDPYERARILADLAGMLARVDEALARDCLEAAIALLNQVKDEKGSLLRKHIVFAILSLHTLKTQEENLETALDLVKQIEDPTEYVNALIAILSMVITGEKAKEILASIYDAIAAIPSTYERVAMLLDVVPLAEQYGDPDDALRLLEEARAEVESISIPYIATMIKKGLVQVMLMVYHKRGDEAIRRKAKEVTMRIEDEESRSQLLSQTGYDRADAQVSPVFTSLHVLREKIKEGRNPLNELSSITHQINTLPDRAKRAAYYIDLFRIFTESKEEKMAERMLSAAIDEAAIIRPLSRRAYVLGDLALNVYNAGFEERSKDILGMAVYAAMNIRDEGLRDEVFYELDVALRIIEERLA
ncbi:MAG TPA: hypothetical protein VMB35_09160 [Methanomicrobiales archaeon]|nr:hypothetical protein [Methanomicrobiales archaeon]